MIVRYVWHTKKDMGKYFKYKNDYLRYRTRDWIGYFLFGIIPLYIKVVGSTFHN